MNDGTETRHPLAVLYTDDQVQVNLDHSATNVVVNDTSVDTVETDINTTLLKEISEGVIAMSQHIRNLKERVRLLETSHRVEAPRMCSTVYPETPRSQWEPPVTCLDQPSNEQRQTHQTTNDRNHVGFNDTYTCRYPADNIPEVHEATGINGQ